jgi:hypothetical protein
VVAGDGLQWIRNIAVNSTAQACFLHSSSVQRGAALTIFSEGQGVLSLAYQEGVWGSVVITPVAPNLATI